MGIPADCPISKSPATAYAPNSKPTDPRSGEWVRYDVPPTRSHRPVGIHEREKVEEQEEEKK